MLTVREYLRENNREAKIFDGLDDAIVGVGCQYTKKPLVIYSASKIIKCYMKQGMTYEGALEFYGYNCECLWCGEGTPIIIDDLNVQVRRKDDEHPPTDTIIKARKSCCSTALQQKSDRPSGKDAPSTGSRQRVVRQS